MSVGFKFVLNYDSGVLLNRLRTNKLVSQVCFLCTSVVIFSYFFLVV